MTQTVQLSVADWDLCLGTILFSSSVIKLSFMGHFSSNWQDERVQNHEQHQEQEELGWCV